MQIGNISFGSFKSVIPGDEPTENFRMLRQALEISKPDVIIKDMSASRDGMTRVKISHKNPETESKIKKAVDMIIENGPNALENAFKSLCIPKKVREEVVEPEDIFRG